MTPEGGSEMRAAMFILLFGCSSRPTLDVPPADAGKDCRDCWIECGKAESRKAASFCSWECQVICEEEQK